MIYLACPYSDPDPKVSQARFREANKAAGALMQKGANVFSPISHTHPIALEVDLPLGWEYWASYDQEMIAHCEELIVLMMSGWEQSRGAMAEVLIAKPLGLDVLYWGQDGINALEKSNLITLGGN